MEVTVDNVDTFHMIFVCLSYSTEELYLKEENCLHKTRINKNVEVT